MSEKVLFENLSLEDNKMKMLKLLVVVGLCAIEFWIGSCALVSPCLWFKSTDSFPTLILATVLEVVILWSLLYAVAKTYFGLREWALDLNEINKQ